jgi:hypothetical protein
MSQRIGGQVSTVSEGNEDRCPLSRRIGGHVSTVPEGYEDRYLLYLKDMRTGICCI